MLNYSISNYKARNLKKRIFGLFYIKTHASQKYVPLYMFYKILSIFNLLLGPHKTCICVKYKNEYIKNLKCHKCKNRHCCECTIDLYLYVAIQPKTYKSVSYIIYI